MAVLLTVVLLLLATRDSGAQADSLGIACRPTDVTAERTLEEFREMLASTDSVEAGLRRNVGLTYQPAPDVALLQDGPLCRTAVSALNQHLTTPGARRAVYLYRIGNEFGVEDPEHGKESEYRGIRIFSQDWQYRGTLLTF